MRFRQPVVRLRHGRDGDGLTSGGTARHCVNLVFCHGRDSRVGVLVFAFSRSMRFPHIDQSLFGSTETLHLICLSIGVIGGASPSPTCPYCRDDVRYWR